MVIISLLRIAHKCCTLLLQKNAINYEAIVNYVQVLLHNTNKNTNNRKKENTRIYNVIAIFKTFSKNSSLECITLASLSRDFDLQSIVIMQTAR